MKYLFYSILLYVVYAVYALLFLVMAIPASICWLLSFVWGWLYGLELKLQDIIYELGVK